jgi:hypothetical protein
MPFSRFAALAVVLGLAVYLPAEAQQPSLTPDQVSLRAKLDKYRDPIVAIYDGYLSSVACIEYPKGASEGSMQYVPGGMGVHFLNMGFVGPILDPAKPQVLIYEPVGDSLRLVAAEWFMPADVAAKTKPAIFGKLLEGPMEGHEPLMPAGFHHYDLHVWLWKNNPAGVYSPTNPAVRCPAKGYSFAEKAPKMVHPHQP